MTWARGTSSRPAPASTILDWESAAPAGLPLSDLLCFLADALVLFDGTSDAKRRPDAVVQFFRGEMAQLVVLSG